MSEFDLERLLGLMGRKQLFEYNRRSVEAENHAEFTPEKWTKF
jgi:hypothetical protein